MKKTLLEIVKDILSAMDSEDVNSLTDSVEALQIASVVEQTFYDIIATRSIPEHESLIKLTSLSNNLFPTHFVMGENTAKVKQIWYDTSDDASFEYKEMKYLSPPEFLKVCDRPTQNYTLVDDRVAGTKLRIVNNAQPTYYTSFDDEHIVFDAFKSTLENTLQSSKTRAIAVTYPVFSISDTYTPDIDAVVFAYLIQEATSRCISLYKGGPDPKIEQAARRNKVHMQNDKRRIGERNTLRNYGRR